MIIEGKSFVSDIKLVDNVSDFRPHEIYSDQPIFNVTEDSRSP